MPSKHFAFLLEQAYGHIVPTLGISLELMRRGHRVSYAVTPGFASAIVKIGAIAKTFDAPEIRSEICKKAKRGDGGYDFSPSSRSFMDYFAQLRRKRTADALSHLEALYRHDRPDLVIHDDCLDCAGRELARRWDIPKVRHVPAIVDRALIDSYAHDRLVLVSVPRFFNPHADQFDDRFRFIGFVPGGREQFFEPWRFSNNSDRLVLCSASTGLVPQTDFFHLVQRAFGTGEWPVVLSVAAHRDPVCDVRVESLGTLPSNFRVNRYSSNLEIMQHACLFVGQGGQGSVIEAMYRGVPTLSIPPTSFHDGIARRVVELGLGARLDVSEVTPGTLRESAAEMIADRALYGRVREAQQRMREDGGAAVAADLLEDYLQVPA